MNTEWIAEQFAADGITGKIIINYNKYDMEIILELEANDISISATTSFAKECYRGITPLQSVLKFYKESEYEIGKWFAHYIYEIMDARKKEQEAKDELMNLIQKLFNQLKENITNNSLS